MYLEIFSTFSKIQSLNSNFYLEYNSTIKCSSTGKSTSSLVANLTTLASNFSLSFSSQSGNIVELGSLDENTSGFKAYRLSDNMFLGDYSDYSTVYKKNESSIEYSNDGSIWVEPEIPKVETGPIETKPMTPAEEAASMSLADRVSQCEECILELSNVVYAE